jgi:hypothetical protein
MSGPRVTSGEDSKQDYKTPDDFIAAVQKRFGIIQFDLAAHRQNARHERYFAPAHFTIKYDPQKTFSVDATVKKLTLCGADEKEVKVACELLLARHKKAATDVANHDKRAFGLDAFKQDWAAISRRFPSNDIVKGFPGLLWDNCEFDDIAPWAEYHKEQGKLGANSLLLTPAAVGSNWYNNHIAGRANVYLLNGRLMFDGKNVFPKDCMLAHFWPGADGSKFIWRWKEDKIEKAWKLLDAYGGPYDKAA